MVVELRQVVAKAVVPHQQAHQQVAQVVQQVEAHIHNKPTAGQAI